MSGDAADRRRVAAIDCGTNSTRLLVAEPDGAGGLDQLDRQMRITRLGQGVDRTGKLDPEAFGRTIEVLRDYHQRIEELGATSVRMTATSAARDADNRDEFFAAAVDAVGARPELLSGAEEAGLSFIGATAGMEPAQAPFLVFDLGGGSTEFAVGTAGTDGPDGALSLDVGCVRLSERFMEHDPPRPEELSAAISLTQTHLDDVLRELPSSLAAKTVIGLAGTVSNVAQIEQGLVTYDRDKVHHFVLTHDAAEDVFRTLATEDRAHRRHNPGLEEGRVDTIVAGCCILVAIFRTFGLEQIVVSEADILDGLALSQLH